MSRRIVLDLLTVASMVGCLLVIGLVLGCLQ